MPEPVAKEKVGGNPSIWGAKRVPKVVVLATTERAWAGAITAGSTPAQAAHKSQLVIPMKNTICEETSPKRDTHRKLGRSGAQL